jgi:hypothetical protein
MDMHKKIADALDVLRHADGKSYFNPAQIDAEILQICNTLLAKRGYQNIPDDYSIFLSQVAGIVGPYFILLTLGGLPLAGGGLQESILRESDVFNESADDDDPKTMVVGKMSGNALVIHQDGKYHVIDAATRDVFRTYDDIADFIVDTVQKKDAAIRATAQQ